MIVSDDATIWSITYDPHYDDRNIFITQATGAVFLVMCDPSMNELWATYTGLSIDLYACHNLSIFSVAPSLIHNNLQNGMNMLDYYELPSIKIQKSLYQLTNLMNFKINLNFFLGFLQNEDFFAASLELGSPWMECSSRRYYSTPPCIMTLIMTTLDFEYC
jgi:hypothetical protein